MIVVDANLLVYLYVAGQRTAQAEAVLARDPVWVAPLLWRSEFRNTLLGLVRQHALALEDVVRIAGEAERASPFTSSMNCAMSLNSPGSSPAAF